MKDDPKFNEDGEPLFTLEMHKKIFVFPDAPSKRSSTGAAVMDTKALIPVTKKSGRARGAIRTANL
jgi:hypothetical protein